MRRTLRFWAFGLGFLLAACGGPGGGGNNGGGGSLDPSRFQAILAAGTDFVLLVKPDGVYAWGDNRFGQLGVDPATLDHRTTPGKVAGVGGAVAVAAQFGVGEYQRHALALMADGRVMSWGVNPYGQLGRPQGDGDLSYQPPDYVVAEGGSEYLSSVEAVDAGHDFTLVLHIHTDQGRRGWASGTIRTTGMSLPKWIPGTTTPVPSSGPTEHPSRACARWTRETPTPSSCWKTARCGAPGGTSTAKGASKG